MAPKHAQAQSLAAQVASIVRTRALDAVAKHDQALSEVYDEIAAGIRTDLRAVGFTNAQVKAVLEKHIGKTKAKRVAIMEEAIRSAAKEARFVDSETFKAVFGEEGASKIPAPFAPPSKPKLKR